MPDHDPANTGGSVAIPPSPVPKPRNWVLCETCGAKLGSQAELDSHLLTHFGSHPVLTIAGKEAVSPLVVANKESIAALEVRHASRLEINGAIVDGSRLHSALLRMNGRNEFDLLLVGRAEHVRQLYRICVAVLNTERVFAIEKAFLAELNRVSVAASDLESFARLWQPLPERLYADALAAFRLAIMMRNDQLPNAPHMNCPDYTHHLADSRKNLASASTPLARTIRAACSFLMNDFMVAEGTLCDSRLENALTYFHHIVDRSAVRWAKSRRGTIELVFDGATRTLLHAVECIRKGDVTAAEKLRTLFDESVSQGDLMTAKKAAAALIHMGVRGPHIEALVGDPVFAAAIVR